jgi:hypothetical protein
MALPQDSGGNIGTTAADDNDALSRIPTHEDFSVGEGVPKPVYSNVYGRMDLTNEGLNTQASITGELSKQPPLRCATSLTFTSRWTS